MRKIHLIGTSLLAVTMAHPAFAQTPSAPAAPQAAQDDAGIQDIVVTAQRQSETLQSVPIAVSAFDSKALKAQQINTTSDLQLTLPNVTFSKGNFTSSSSFNIRGIGDLCVGVTCDAATAVHVNDVPILGSPIFQNEYFDMERIEVLRGPQGTLYGRNATGGVINFITAKPDLSGFHADGEVEYGNFNSIRVKGMVNAPIGETLGVRLAGYYLKRDGFTNNIFTGHKIDGRDQFDIRGSIRFEPTADTKIDIVGHWFKESDNRSRIQKQLCNRDTTGILGCTPDKLGFGQLNGNATIASILTSRQFLALNGLPTAFALGSVYGPDVYSNFTNPADLRTVSIDFEPTFKTEEKQVLVHLEHSFDKAKISLSGGYTEGFTDSAVDYNLGVENRAGFAPGLATLQFAASGGLGAGLQAYLKPVADALIPNGATGALCQSLAEPTGTGVYGGHSICAASSLDFDRSTAYNHQWTGEAIVESKLDGKLNFLLGGVYLDSTTRNNDYYVNSFALDYAAGLIGSFSALGAGLPPAYLGPPFFRSNSRYFRLKSYGLFGEAYYAFSDRAKLTLGLRYNHDDKFISARTSFPGAPGAFVPYGAANYTNALNYAALDFDATRTGNQEYADNRVTFGRLTGRAVFDFQITPRNLLYASYSRGYKSGGINPPLSPVFAVPTDFGPETVDAFEIGSKNQFLDGTLRLNLTAFYYKYKSLQLSRIVARTSVNDNVDADIYGLEAEAIIKPARELQLNMNFSYLNTKIAADKFLGNTQDPSGGRSDAVIIKDLTNASNCAVGSNTGSAVASNTLVTAINGSIGLQAPVPVAGTTTTGAYSVCSALQNAIVNPSAPLRALFATPTGALPFTLYSSGVPVNIRGNQLPQSPNYKFSTGIQYTGTFDNGMTLVPRFDLSYTGGYFGSIFNKNINRIQGYVIMNAQAQLNGPDGKWFVRAFIQNLANNNAITGLYVTDQSSGLFTNAFTLEPRRYGVSAGFKF